MAGEQARLGRRIRENVYWRDEPVICLPVEQAEALVARLNELGAETADPLVLWIRAKVSILGNEILKGLGHAR